LLAGIRKAIRGVLLAWVGAAAAGCHSRPTPGDRCRVPDQLVCTAADRAVVCDSIAPRAPPPPPNASQPDRAWLEVPCKGARGCARVGEDDECDDALASVGDPCPRNPPLDYACTTDLSQALVCRDGRFDLWRRCRGPQGCRLLDGRNVHCDTSVGEVDDPCERPGTYACSVDGKTMLECDGKSLTVAAACRGPKACFFEPGETGSEPHKIDCDDGVAEEGDPCTQPRRITCALDHKEELVCDGHTFAKKRDCRKSDCRIEGVELFCD
jgi:hypothetical protein